MAVANVVFQDPRYNWVYCYTDEYLPTNSTLTINGVNARQFVTYTAAGGWTPQAGAASQGVIGFTYTPNTFILGDTFVITNSAGTSTISNYGPVPSNNMNLYYDASLNSSYSGAGTTWYNVATAGSYTGTLTNGAFFDSSNGGSMFFDGVDDYVPIDSSTGLNFTNSTNTISLWFKTPVASPGAYLIAKNMGATGGWGVTIGSDGVPYFETKNNASGASAAYRYANTVVNDNVWHNMVAVFTTSTTVVANNTISIYMDGALANGALTQVLVYGGNTASNVEIGRRAAGNYYSGYVSNVQIWDKGITAAQVFQNYNALKPRFNVGNSLVTNGAVLNLDASDKNSLSLNSTTWNDTSGNSNNGTLTSGPVFNYLNGGGVYFNGSAAYVNVANAASLNATTQTINAWINNSSASDSTFILGKHDITGSFNGYVLSISGNILTLTIKPASGGANLSATSFTFSRNTWYFVSLTFSSGGTMSMYINGVFITSTSCPSFTLSSQPLRIGVSVDSFWSKFQGYIGHVQVYNRVLTLTEIQTNYNATRSRFNSYPFGVYNGLVQYVDAGNRQSYIGTGSTWSDISGATTNNTLVNTPTFFGGIVGGALNFNGTSQWANMGTSTYMNVINFTVSVWVLILPGGATDQYFAVRYSNTNLNNGWLLSYNQTTGKIAFQGQEASTVFTLTSSGTYLRNTWYNVTGTKSGNTWSLYVNGVLDSSQSLGVGTSAFLTNTMYLAGTNTNSSNYYSNCRISQARFYNRALTLAEVKYNYDTYRLRYSTYSDNIVSNGLVQYLDAGNVNSYAATGSTFMDLSSSNNTGTIANTTYNAGNYGNLVYNGTSSYVETANNSTLNPTSGLTVSAWVKKSYGSSVSVFIDKGRDNYGAWSMLCDNVANKFNMRCRVAGVNYTLQFNDPYGNNLPTHIAATFTGTYIITYINGVLDNITTAVGALGTNANSLYVGRANDGFFYSGTCYNSFIYNRGLLPNEILQNYNAQKARFLPSTITTTSLGLYLDAGNSSSYSGSGSTWSDISGNRNNATLVGTPVFSLSGFGFNGTTQYATIPSAATIKSTSTLSIEAWVYYTGSGFLSIIGKGTSDADEEYTIMMSGTQVYFDVGGGSGPYTQPSYTFTANTWYHITCTHSRPSTTSTLTVYVNGVALSGSTINPTTSVNSNSTSVTVGARFAGSTLWKGGIAILRIYTKVLSLAEIVQNFTAQSSRFLSSNTVNASLQTYLDSTNSSSYSGSGSTWSDISGNAINVSLVGSPTYTSGSLPYFTFNGSTQYALNASVSNFNVGCIDIWFRPSSLINASFGGSTLLQLKVGATTNNWWYIGLGNVTGLLTNEYITIVDGSSNRLGVTDGGSLAANTWVNVVINWESSTYKFYINNVVKTTSSSGSIGQLTAPNTYIIGAFRDTTSSAYSPSFAGDLGIVKIYSTGLTLTQLYQNYNVEAQKYLA